jgi:hypothetical protein
VLVPGVAPLISGNIAEIILWSLCTAPKRGVSWLAGLL